MQGWRKTQEDAHIAKLDLGDGNALFAVFDGHGGDQVAHFAEKHMAEELLQLESYKSGDYKTSLEEVFLKIDEMMIAIKNQQESQGTYGNEHDGGEPNNFSEAGCTSNVILLTKDKIYCANSGDSRAVLSQNGQTVELSEDHKPDNLKEKTRIEKADGFVSMGRTNGIISLSRALGDFDYKQKHDLSKHEQQITAFPDISENPINEDTEFIIQACDGIWDCLTSEEAVRKFGEMLKKGGKSEKQIVEQVLEEIIAPDSSNGVGCDNMTCILIRFNK
ncbi:protein phosphatase 2c [Stylonychia lemnae]|uniref:protein-serine/threonine phosphatase n=1 Tax=Stylonychia lemnae TaxID=5949 RepID=A0A077ZMX3_STYLE|nr:protein phosphatase 2c [Stylonychia lemnae]|eukprot:CDW71278.1 protein phosphatase 2c [Stylonychia lemnae]